MANANWTRLKSGEWGARIYHTSPFDTVTPGDEITVETKAGKLTPVKVKNIIWQGIDDRTNETATIVGIERLVDDRE